MEEKGVTSEIIDSDTNDLSSEILEVSPYAELPVLVDRVLSWKVELIACGYAHTVFLTDDLCVFESPRPTPRQRARAACTPLARSLARSPSPC